MRIISLKSLLLLLLLAFFQFASLGEENLPIPFLSLDASGTAPWNMLGHDARHTGRNPFMGLLNGAASTKSRFKLGESRMISSPSVGSDGTIYLGAGYVFAFPTWFK